MERKLGVDYEHEPVSDEDSDGLSAQTNDLIEGYQEAN
jgi:hypothetical protein